MNEKSLNRRNHAKLDGVWALGIILPRPERLAPWQVLFPFTRIRRPGAISTAQAGGWSVFGLVWAEPQGNTPGRIINNRSASTIVEPRISKWEPLQEKQPFEQEKIIPAKNTDDALSATDSNCVGTAPAPFISNAVFALTKRIHPTLITQFETINFAQTRFSQFHPLSGMTSEVVRRMSYLDGKLSNHNAENTMSMGTPQDDDALPFKKTPLADVDSPGAPWVQPQSLPHLIPLNTMMTRFIEETVNQKLNKLVGREINTVNERASRPDANADPVSSGKIIREPSGKAWDEENVRLILEKLQALAREDRFRMGL